jgi:hypothetical protein
MADKYLRIVKATFSGGGGGLVVTDLKIEFDVEKTISGVPNAGTVRVYNLSAAHRQAVGKEFDSVQLEAGYQGTGTGIILKGKIREVFHERDETDVITEVKVGDGDEAERKGYVAKTYPTGTKIKDIVEDIRQNGMPGISRGELKGLDDLPATKRPLTLVSGTRRAMDQLGRSHNFYWSYQNEALETIPADGFLDQRVVISARTGMIGVPTVTDNGISVQCLLDPAIRPNRLIEVISDVLDMNGKPGIYRVNGLHYYGDNMDGDFAVDVEGQTVSGGKVAG